jgi:hypothetical protein
MYKIKVILLAIILAPLHVMAEQIEVPNEFVDQTPAQASEVNQNFKAVADGVNAQDVRIQNVESAIAGPAEMVFLGYTAGVGVNNGSLHGMNQVCKDAYSNPAARVVTITAWTTFINEGQLPLPSASATIWGNSSAYQAPSGYYVIQPGGWLYFSPSGATITGLFACMAPAVG